MTYDSREDTKKHVLRVQALAFVFRQAFKEQVAKHDQSKLESPEVELFDEWTPKLAGLTYGSEEYQAALKALGPALSHHYRCNRHHPEHWPDGVAGMTLMDLVEMFCDWKAASERHANGNLQRSIELNTARFQLDPQVAKIFENTRQALGW